MFKNTIFRRMTALVLTLALAAAAALPGLAVYPMPIQTASETEAVYLFNADTGKTILNQNADQQQYVASLTKLMTALLLLESGKDLNGEVTVPTALTQEFRDIQNANGTTMGLRIGETVRRIDLLNSRGAEQTVNDFLAAHGARYPIAKGYGMTEVSSAATVAAGLDNKPGSVGIPMVNTVVAAFEPGTDQELPIGQRGELCISGPCLMKGYYNKPEETAILLRRHPDGRVWAHTGDMGYLDEDGFVFLDSRIKRMIIRHDGFKVFPSMIENVVSRHPAVHQCSVVGCADKDHTQGRLPFVYIVLKANTTAKKKQVIRELERMCAEELPEYVQPVAYKFISSMPMTPVGKVDYRQLEADISPRDY